MRLSTEADAFAWALSAKLSLCPSHDSRELTSSLSFFAAAAASWAFSLAFIVASSTLAFATFSA